MKFKIKNENKKNKAKMLIGIGSGVVVGFILGRIHENLIVYEKIEDIINGNCQLPVVKTTGLIT